MPSISNTRTSSSQTVPLDTERMSSSIPRADIDPATTTTSGDKDNVWAYPSPQQMFNAVIRKGHTDTDPSGIPAMVAVHNWLNEGTWAEVERWDSVFRGRTLWEAWKVCARGRENLDAMLERQEEEWERMRVARQEEGKPKLERFQGRPGELTPRARMLGLLGRMFPEKFS
ncbi:holocytochrome c synthase, partial [Ascosphaera pollenicola]